MSGGGTGWGVGVAGASQRTVIENCVTAYVTAPEVTIAAAKVAMAREILIVIIKGLP
jgi:hypothetical protein